MQKKTSFTELFYITLLLTALRPPDNSLLYPRPFPYGSSDSIGPIIAENICFNPANRYPDSNGGLCSEYLNTKSSILLRETLEVLEDINSLGRYSQPLHSYSLFAYPVSRGLPDVLNELDTTVSLDSPPPPPSPTDNSISNQLFDEFENLNFNTLDDLNIDLFNLENDPLLDLESSIFESTNEPESGSNDSRNPNGNSEESIDTDQLLADSSVMFPILDSDRGDVNDLFGELELFLSNETEDYAQEWQNTAFFTPVSTVENTDYSIYDSANIVPDTRNMDNCNLYEHTNNNGPINANSTASYSNNFGAVLYSSLTTLSNGNEALNTELAPTNVIYNSSDVSDLAYMSNVSNVSANNVSVSDCFYGGYMTEEFNISDMSSINNSQFNYQPPLPNQQSSNFVTPPPPVNQFAGSTNATPTATGTEDCFDKSSDSAVSSMSSDRIHSFSDNDWVETSSESSSYNGEVNLSDYHNNDNKCNAAAQKKYRLFGKSKSGDFKNASQLSNYYVDYSHGNYVYCNSGQPNPAENYTQMNYYATAVSHNHTYSQPAEVAPLSSVSSNIPTSEWNSSESSVDLNSSKKSSSSSSVKSSSKKQQDNAENIKIDHQLNRDEKRARSLKLPISTHDIINLPIDEFNERLTKYELTEMQLSLIRDIRRRGKNKVAAQNCRKRKLDQIMGLQSEVDTMFSQKDSLENQYNQLLMLRELARDKYTKLYQFIVEASSSRQPFFDITASPPDFPDKDTSREVQLNGNVNNSFMVSNNISSPVHVSSYGTQNEFSKPE